MRKFHYLLLGAAALVASSCSQDEPLLSPTGQGNFNVKVSLPADMATRAVDMNTGKVANNLNYAIFDADDDSFVTEGAVKFEGTNLLQTTVSLNLPKGKSYKISFFAQSQASETEQVYVFDGEQGTITVNYENMTGEGTNEFDTYDCFVNQLPTGIIGSNTVNTSVTLYRPIAQLNWGSNDLNEDAVAKAFGTAGAYITTTLTTKAYNTFSLLDNDVDMSVEPVDVTFADFGLPQTAAGTTAPYPTVPTTSNSVSTYGYVAMQYLLAPKESTVCDLNLNITNSLNPSAQMLQTDVVVASAPVQANYRTNIYGALLTDNVNITVTKSPDWYNPDYYHEIWDGVTMTQPTQQNDTWLISSAGEWAWFVANKNATYNGSVKLTGDLDFGGHDIMGIRFTGTFDGQGHTISNLNITPRSSYATGFFAGDIGSGELTVSNVNFVNVTITNLTQAYGWVGVVIADLQQYDMTLNNVNVRNANLKGVKSIAGLVGFVSSDASLTMTDCSVTDSNLSNIPVLGESGFIGGLVGRPVGSVTATGCTVSNTTINGYWAADRGEASIQAAIGNQPNPSGVTVDNVTVNRTEVTENITVNGTVYTTIDEAIANAPNGSTINLGVSSYKPSATLASNKTLTFVGMGAEYTEIDAQNAYWTATGSNFTFSDLSLVSFLNTVNHTSMGFRDIAQATFNNVTFNGEFHCFSGNQTFNDCSFVYDQPTGTNYQLWLQSTGTTKITNCTFTCGPAKAILVYAAEKGQVGGNINIDGITVTAQTASDKGVVEVHTENYGGKCGTITINNVTYPSSLFGGGLWRQINNNTGAATDNYTIVVN